MDYTVLDVTTSRWHDDYNSFKDVVKDLEASASNMDLNLSLSTARYLSIFRREIGFVTDVQLGDVEHPLGRESNPPAREGEANGVSGASVYSATIPFRDNITDDGPLHAQYY